MTNAQAGFGHNSWIEVCGWGHGVIVRSGEDISAVGELIADEEVNRRAVMFQNMSASKRKSVATSIEGLGVELRRFTRNDKAAWREASGERLEGATIGQRLIIGVMPILAAPLRIVMLSRGRTNSMYELVGSPGR